MDFKLKCLKFWSNCYFCYFLPSRIVINKIDSTGEIESDYHTYTPYSYVSRIVINVCTALQRFDG